MYSQQWRVLIAANAEAGVGAEHPPAVGCPGWPGPQWPGGKPQPLWIPGRFAFSVDTTQRLCEDKGFQGQVLLRMEVARLAGLHGDHRCTAVSPHVPGRVSALNPPHLGLRLSPGEHPLTSSPPGAPTRYSLPVEGMRRRAGSAVPGRCAAWKAGQTEPGLCAEWTPRDSRAATRAPLTGPL